MGIGFGICAVYKQLLSASEFLGKNMPLAIILLLQELFILLGKCPLYFRKQ